MEISGLYGMKASMLMPLNEEQQSTLAEILTKYDAENMSEEDKKALRQDLADAGMPRSRATLDMLKDAGFDLGVNKTESDSALPSQASMLAGKGKLWDLYQQFQSGDISEQDFISQIGSQISAGSLFTLVS